MEGSGEVLLFGTWASGYCTRIELALKLKGIPYKFMEEDLGDKSELLLKYNPVHKKVPVLVHNGKPVAESLVILEYIDETWNHAPKFLPEDPYERAKIRFWANFYDQKIAASAYPVMASSGEEQVKALENFWYLLKVFEEGTQKDFPKKFPFYNGDNLGFLDIVVATTAGYHESLNEAIGPMFDAEKLPAFMSWVNALIGHPLVKERLHPKDKFVAKLKMRRKSMT